MTRHDTTGTTLGTAARRLANHAVQAGNEVSIRETHDELSALQRMNGRPESCPLRFENTPLHEQRAARQRVDLRLPCSLLSQSPLVHDGLSIAFVRCVVRCMKKLMPANAVLLASPSDLKRARDNPTFPFEGKSAAAVCRCFRDH